MTSDCTETVVIGTLNINKKLIQDATALLNITAERVSDEIEVSYTCLEAKRFCESSLITTIMSMSEEHWEATKQVAGCLNNLL